jgi:hypothetical protein
LFRGDRGVPPGELMLLGVDPFQGLVGGVEGKERRLRTTPSARHSTSKKPGSSLRGPRARELPAGSGLRA